jgi:hypothetical protein
MRKDIRVSALVVLNNTNMSSLPAKRVWKEQSELAGPGECITYEKTIT